MSEQQILDCDTLSDDHGCKGGFPGSAWSYVHKAGGIESEENYPYVGSQGTCTFDLDKAVANVTACYHSISEELNPFCINSSIIRNEGSLIQALNDRPLTIVLDASSMQHYGGGIFHNTGDRPCTSQNLNHALFAVGYEKHEDLDSFYIIKNSWDTHWGIDGYLHLALGENNTCGVADYPGYAVAGNL